MKSTLLLLVAFVLRNIVSQAQTCTPGTVYAVNASLISTPANQAAAAQQGLYIINPANETTTRLVQNLFGGGAALTAVTNGAGAATSAIALDMDNNIIWFCNREGTGTHTQPRIFSYNLNTNSYGTTVATFSSTNSTGGPTLAGPQPINKAAYNPVDKCIYFHLGTGTTNQLYKFNPATPATQAVLVGTLSVTGYTVDQYTGGDIAFDGLGNLTGVFNPSLILANFPAQYDAAGAYLGFSLAGQRVTSISSNQGSLAFLPDGNYLMGGAVGTYSLNSNSGAETAVPGTDFPSADFASCVTPTPNLVLSKTANLNCTAGTLTYTITVQNTGNAHALNSLLIDTLPAGVTLSSATLNGAALTTTGMNTTGVSVRSSTATTAGQILKGETATIILNCTVPANTNGSIRNQAFVKYTGVEVLNLTNDQVPSNDPGTVDAGDATIVVGCMPASGTIYNDNNGMTGGPNGSAPPTTTVTLYAADGTTVIATTTTDGSGVYNFGSITAGSRVVGVTPPGLYRHVSSTDATPLNGLTSIAPGASTAINFGINLPPTAVSNAVSNQTPGSPAVIANIRTNDSDPNGGTLSTDSITLIAPVGATGIVIDAQGDTTGFTVPNVGSWSLNSSTGVVTFTPYAYFGGDPPAISYTITDAAGLTSNAVTITADYATAATTSGVLYSDANGTTGGVNGSTLAAGVTVTLYAPDGTTVVQTTTSIAGGVYSFANLPPGTFIVAVTPPNGYVHASSTDASPTDGRTTITITGVVNQPNINFGVQQPSTATQRDQTITTPTGFAIPPGTLTQNLLGSDPEDGALGNANTMVVTQLPTNATMVYNGSPVTLNQQISNFNPANLSFTGISLGATSTAFNYAFRDAANYLGAAAAYTVSWSTALPVKLKSFTGHVLQGNHIQLQWQVLLEENFDRYEMEFAGDAISFVKIGTVRGGLAGGKYSLQFVQPAASGYYRLKMIDLDGTIAFSTVIRVFVGTTGNISIVPNPAVTNTTVTGTRTGDKLVLYSLRGQLLQTIIAKGSAVAINVEHYAAGTYILQVVRDNQFIQQQKLVKR